MQAVGTCSPQKDEVGTPTRTPSGAIRYLINYLGESPKSPTSPKPRLRDQKPLPPVIGQAKKRALHVAYAAAHFTTLGSTLGLRWRDVGVEKPVTGTEIQNTALATALEGDKWKFTKQELNNFKIDMSDLTSSTFIKAGNKYWAAGRAPRLGSEGTSEEIEAENRELRNEIEKLERKLDNYQEMLKHSRASYDAAVHTLMRTITQDETVAVALLVQKYEEERSQSTKELELIKKVLTTLLESGWCLSLCLNVSVLIVCVCSWLRLYLVRCVHACVCWCVRAHVCLLVSVLAHVCVSVCVCVCDIYLFDSRMLVGEGKDSKRP